MGDATSATPLEKSDEPQDARPATAKQPQKPGRGSRSKAQS